MRHLRRLLIVKTLLIAGALLLTSAWTLPEGDIARAQGADDLANGRTLFNTYCASCHGTEGTGSGPLAAALRRLPPDITGLALANGGVFPADRLRRIIDGREVESHGNREMPVWGDAFKSIPGGHSNEAVQARIRAILDYLAGLQRRRV